MPHTTRHLSPLRILIADSCPYYVESLATWLGYWGHEAKAVEESTAALDALHFFSPDLLMIDMESPGMAAIKVILTIRAEMPKRTLLIVAVTTDTYGPTRLRSIAAGADYVLSKPTDPDELLHILTRRQNHLTHGLAGQGNRKPWLGLQLLTTE
jgi:CheY-like chemotaxis protein